MGFISAFGTIGAAPTAGWASSRRRGLGRLLFTLPLIAAAPPSAELDLRVEGLRSAKGQVLLCLTRIVGEKFLDCRSDPRRVVRQVPAASAGSIRLAGMEPGEWSLLLVHDENGNGKLDKAMGMPREGFGFSHNPKLRMGPPHYADVHFTLPAGRSQQIVKVRYLL